MNSPRINRTSSASPKPGPGSRTDQASAIADRLGHSDFRYLGARPENQEWSSGIAITSRWPIAVHSHHDLTTRDGEVRGLLGHVDVDGPRGGIQVFGVMLDYPLGASASRLHQVQQMLDIVAASIDRRAVTILCGDFNAPPDSDEIRVLTGRAGGRAERSGLLRRLGSRRGWRTWHHVRKRQPIRRRKPVPRPTLRLRVLGMAARRRPWTSGQRGDRGASGTAESTRLRPLWGPCRSPLLAIRRAAHGRARWGAARLRRRRARAGRALV